MDSIAIMGASPKSDYGPPLATPFLALWSPSSSATSPSKRVEHVSAPFNCLDGDIQSHADPEVYTVVGIPGPGPASADIWTIHRAGRMVSSLFVCLRQSASRRSGPRPLWPYPARAPPRPHRASGNTKTRRRSTGGNSRNWTTTRRGYRYDFSTRLPESQK